MPGSDPGPDSMGGRPPVMWKSASRGTTQLTGNVPDWTQSPLWSVFSDSSARKVRDSPIMAALGLDLTDDNSPEAADTPARAIPVPDYQRVAAKNSPAHGRGGGGFVYSPPSNSSADCHTLSGEGFREGAHQGASVTGTPLYIKYHPLRFVPKSKFVKGKDVEEEEEEKVAERDKEAMGGEEDFPKNLVDFEARLVNTAAAAKAAQAGVFHDEDVPQGRSSWNHADAKGEYDKDLEEDNHLNVVAAALRPQQLRMVGETHLSAADTNWEDYLFDQLVKGKNIMSSARAPQVVAGGAMLRQEVGLPMRARKGEEEEMVEEPLEEVTEAHNDEEYDHAF